MRITTQNTDEAVLRELGVRLRRTRLDRNLSQEALAEEAGVSPSTVKRIERGESAQLGSAIRILRFLGLLDGLDQLIPEPAPSPVERLRHRGRERQRASRPRKPRPGAPDESTPWRWGDELTEIEE